MIFRKNLPSAAQVCLFTIQSVLASLILLGFVPAVHAQILFNGVSNVLPVNGATLGAQDHAAADPFGNVYVTDPGTNQVFKVAPNGTASVLISSTAQFNGLPLNGPGAVATDHNGGVYIADTNNYRILYAPSGGAPVVLTVLGSGVIPAALAVDFSGNVYVCEQNTNGVLEIQIPSGPPLGIGVSPLTLNNPQGVAVDYTGAVYIADTGNGRVVKAVGGHATVVSTGSISLSQPVGVAVDGQLNVYIVDAGTNQVVELPAVGTPFVPGTGSNTLSQPNGISFDGKATIYIMDQGNDRVVTEQFASVNFGSVAVGGAGVTIPLTFTVDSGTTIGNSYIKGPGGTSPHFTVGSNTCTNGTTATSCTIQVTFQPLSVGAHNATVVINDQSSTPLISLPLTGAATGPILAFSPGAISHYAGIYNYYCYCLLVTGPPQPAATAILNIPAGMRVDEAGFLYFLDYGDADVRVITPAGYISTVVGTNYPALWANQPNEGDGGPAIDSAISPEWGVGLDGQDNIYVPDTGMNEVREDTAATGIINKIAGIWDPYFSRVPYSGDGGPAGSATMTRPFDVTTDGNGNIYFSDNSNLVIRKIDNNGIITTVAGIANGVRAYSGDGLPATQAQFYNPTSLVVDNAGDLIIGDPNNAVVREMTPDGILHTIVGNHALGAGYTGDNGPATEAQINYPSGVAVDGGDNMYIADQYNDAIRMVTTDGTISTVAAIGPCNPPNASEMCYLGPNPSNGSGAGPQYAGPFVAQPYSIAAEANGNLFFSDFNGNVIDKIDVADPPSINFGNVVINTGSFEQDVTLENLGTEPMHITKFTISANFIFGSDSTCNTGGGTVILQPGHSCTIGILFWPLVSGNLSGAVGIVSDAQGGGTTNIPLSGTAAAQSQAINFPALTNQSYTSTPIALGATASSGLTVSYTVTSGLATVSGNQLTMTGLGALTVRATQTGNAEYAAAPPVSISFGVSPVMTPHPQSNLTDAPQVISWLAGPADTAFQLLLGTTGQGSSNLFNSGVISATSVTLPNLPYNGAHIYATLLSFSTMGWQSNNINYFEGQSAALSTPTPGSTLTSASETFTWTSGNGIANYWFNLGTGDSGANAKNIYSTGSTTQNSATVSGIPTGGGTLYATLYSYFNGAWQPIVYTYTASGSPTPGALVTPTPGATLISVNATFTWTPGTGVTNYWLNLGTGSSGAAAKNIYSGSSTTLTSINVNGLPSNGETIYATLFNYIGGTWQPILYTYTASGSPTPAALITPTPSSTLTSTNVTFTWSPGSNVQHYWFDLGTASSGASAKNIYSGSSTTLTSVTLSGLPANGETIYATLYSYIGGTWQPTVYTYTASGSPTPAALVTPTPGSTLAGSAVTFTWSPGSNVQHYWFNLGTAASGANAKNIYSGSSTTATSGNLTGLPTNGVTIYATLYSYIGGAWQPIVYTYKAQ